MNVYLGENGNEIGLMSLLDDLIVLENGKRYTIDGYINKLQNNWNELKKFLEEGQKAGQRQENYLTINICNLILDKMKELEEK